MARTIKKTPTKTKKVAPKKQQAKKRKVSPEINEFGDDDWATPGNKNDFDQDLQNQWDLDAQDAEDEDD